MRTKHLTRAAGLALVSLALIAPAALAQDATPMAPAMGTPISSEAMTLDVPLVDAAGDAVGLATFTEGDNGVTIHLLVQGLTPGEHGWHLHEFGSCDGNTDEPFSSAGGHWNPTEMEHGAPDAAMHHVGDFGNFEATADGMAEAVDHAGGAERHGQHLEGEHGDAAGPEQQHVDGQRGVDADKAVAVQVVLEPVVGRAAAVLLDRGGIGSLHLVNFSAAPQDGAQAMDHRAVGIVLRLAERMVLAVHGHPLPGDHAGGHPDPQAEEMADGRMQVDGPVGLVTMQVERHRGHGHLDRQEGDQGLLPAVEAEQAIDMIGKKIQHLPSPSVGKVPIDYSRCPPGLQGAGHSPPAHRPHAALLWPTLVDPHARAA